MKSSFISLIVISSITLTSCIAPVNTTFDRAATLGKNRLELNGAYSHYSQTKDGRSDSKNNNFGGRIGFGLSDKTDLKVRYEHIVTTAEPKSEVNYLSIVPKTQIIANKISIIVPLSCYFEDAIIADGSRYTVAPEIIATHTMSKYGDVTVTAKGEYLFGNSTDADDFYIGFKLGFGLSSDINKWAIRPEGGLLLNPGETGQFWSYGVGLVLNLSTKNFFKKGAWKPLPFDD